MLESTINTGTNATYFGETEIADVDRNGLWYDRAEMVDSVCVFLCLVMWVLPHGLVFWYRQNLERLPGPSILTSWEESLRFLENETQPE